MATQNEQQGPVKNRWTRWYMWFIYGSAAFLVLVVALILIGGASEQANLTPEERMAQAEANARQEASKQQTKTSEDLHKEQTKEAESQPLGLGISRQELQEELTSIIQWGDPDKLEDGTPRIAGRVDDTLLLVVIIGPADNVTMVDMSFFATDLGSNVTNIQMFNMLALVAVPQWEDRFDWMEDAMQDVIEKGKEQKQTRVGNRVVTLSRDDILGVAKFTLKIEAVR